MNYDWISGYEITLFIYVGNPIVVHESLTISYNQPATIGFPAMKYRAKEKTGKHFLFSVLKITLFYKITMSIFFFFSKTRIEYLLLYICILRLNGDLFGFSEMEKKIVARLIFLSSFKVICFDLLV